MNPLRRAISAFGSNAALARALGVKPMAVSHWLRRGLPAKRAVQIEKALNGQVTKEELCPEVFATEEAAPPAADAQAS